MKINEMKLFARNVYNIEIEEFGKIYDYDYDKEIPGVKTYIEEKYTLMKRDVGNFIFQLDDEHLQKFWDVLYEREKRVNKGVYC